MLNKLLVLKFSYYPIIKQRTFLRLSLRKPLRWYFKSLSWDLARYDEIDCERFSHQHQLNIFANTDSGALESPNTTSNLNFKRSSHLQGWVNISHNMAVLQAATISVPMASEKYIWQLKFQQKLPVGNQQIKKIREKCEKFIDPWTNYQWINC